MAVGSGSNPDRPAKRSGGAPDPGLKATSATAAAPPFRATIPSDFQHGSDVEQQIVTLIEQQNYSPGTLFAIKIALEEALVNAIKHGNKLDPRKQVFIEASVSPMRTEIVIEDQGPGFSRAAVPDPLADENLEKPSGRGILLIESYMTRVEWSHGGRRLRMIKEAAEPLPDHPLPHSG